MNTFTASNGITVFVRDGATIQFQHGTREESSGILQIIPGSEWWQTLREFFRADDDARLERWRWPEEPDYVVYPSGVAVRVLYEATGADTYPLYRDSIPGSRPARAALAYFAAHPEPKPWHDAKPGDHWALHIPSGATMPDEFHLFKVTRWMDRDGWFFVPTEGGSVFALNDSAITAGRRVWPEVAS